MITVRLLLIDQSSILFLSQTNKHGGRYTLVGGKIDQKELAKEALIRESFEEIGITIQPDDLTLVHVVHKRKKSEPNYTEIILVFQVTKWKGEPFPKESKKFSAVTWLPANDLPFNLSATTAHIMKEVKASNLYSEYRTSSGNDFDFSFQNKYH
jgi:8-oxo-dGTP pyrophosphatase MutT (NUDIX family)